MHQPLGGFQIEGGGADHVAILDHETAVVGHVDHAPSTLFEEPRQAAVLAAAGGGEEDAPFAELLEDGPHLLRDAAVLVEQGAVHVTDDEPWVGGQRKSVCVSHRGTVYGVW